MSSCRECRFFDLAACQDRAGRVRKDRVARCNWVDTNVYPTSAMKSPWPNVPVPTQRLSFMLPSEGQDCLCFIAKEPSQ